MNLGVIKARVRRLKGSPTTSRWTDFDLADLANEASIQLAMEVDYPQATRIIAVVQPLTTAPTLALSGAAGPQVTVYAVAVVAQDGGGDSAPSPNAQIANAPLTLSATDYVGISWPSIAGTTYRVLRQRKGIDQTPMLLTSALATGTAATVNDQGQFVPQSYRIARGNEYQLPELVKILRVYLASPTGSQQPLLPSDPNLLEGVVNETWDQTSGQIIGAPAYTPQWIAQPPQAFPIASPFGRANVATPWEMTAFGGQRPVYYLRGGYLGILPPTIAGIGYQIIVEHVPKPVTLQQNSDLSLFPDAFCDAICWKMLEYMAIADDDSRDQDFRARFDAEARKLRIEYVDAIMANKPRSLVPLTIRTQMREWPL